MSTSSAALIADRLQMFSALLDKVETQWRGRDIEEIGAARLAPDMHPLAWQIAAVALQARMFAGWVRGEEVDNTVQGTPGWSQARTELREAQAAIEAARTATAPERKRIEIGMIGMYLDLTGQRYVDDWLLPNLYFHLTTAYAIMRMKGAQIGKADFLSHLMSELRPIEAPASA